jgi:hypothetical protein
MKQKFIIVDWADNHCFTNKKFDSYEDGWDFLYSKFPVIDGDDREDELSSYYVIEEKP